MKLPLLFFALAAFTPASAADNLTRGGFGFSMTLHLQPEAASISYCITNNLPIRARLREEFDLFYSRYITSPLPEHTYYRLRLVDQNGIILSTSQWSECADYGGGLITDTAPMKDRLRSLTFEPEERRTRQIPVSAYISTKSPVYREFTTSPLRPGRLQCQIVTTLSRRESVPAKSEEYIQKYFLTTPWFDWDGRE